MRDGGLKVMIGATRRMLTGQKLARLESRDSEDSSGQLFSCWEPRPSSIR
jgi:hypothetical protein